MTERRNEKDAMGGEERGRSPSGATPIAGELQAGPLPPNGRWSPRRKQQVVLRMLRGEPLDASRENWAWRSTSLSCGGKRRWAESGRPSRRGKETPLRQSWTVP